MQDVLDVSPDSPIYEPHSPLDPPPAVENPGPVQADESERVDTWFPEEKPKSVCTVQRRTEQSRRFENNERRRRDRFRQPYSRPDRRRRQVTDHSGVTAVLAIGTKSYTLTNGIYSYSEDWNDEWDRQLTRDLQEMDVGRLYVVDAETKRKVRQVCRDEKLEPILIVNKGNVGLCTFCRRDDCHRWNAIVGGIQKILRMLVDPIRH